MEKIDLVRVKSDDHAIERLSLGQTAGDEPIMVLLAAWRDACRTN